MMFKNISNNYMSSERQHKMPCCSGTKKILMPDWRKQAHNRTALVSPSKGSMTLTLCRHWGKGIFLYSVRSTLRCTPCVYVRARWCVCVHAFVSCLLCLKVLRWPPPSRVPHWRVWLGCCCHRRYRPRPLMCPATLGKGGGEDRAASCYSGTNR